MMGDKERSKSEEKEIKIAVLSVLKKGSILKRLFLNLPPPHPPHPTTAGDGGHIPNPGGGEVDDEDRPILFGRHPDCHVVLDHPSISRFHLAARLVPSLQKLAVTDLSSGASSSSSSNSRYFSLLLIVSGSVVDSVPFGIQFMGLGFREPRSRPTWRSTW